MALTPVAGSTSYAPLTNCSWVISPAGMSYIKLSFSSYASETLYDTLLVEDGDGVVAVLSGGLYGTGGASLLPAPLYTDTGESEGEEYTEQVPWILSAIRALSRPVLHRVEGSVAMFESSTLCPAAPAFQECSA